MPVALYRIDDRLIHGQVVVGWGQPLNIGFIVLVDDNVATATGAGSLPNGSPSRMEIIFADVAEAVRSHSAFVSDPRRGIIVTPRTSTRCSASWRVRSEGNKCRWNSSPRGRTPRLRYVFLTADEEIQIRALMERGIKVTAQDVPSARPVPMSEVLGGGEANA